MNRIDEKLGHPGVFFVPRTKLGKDLTIEEILGWGLNAVVLANGAWRDRSLPLPGIGTFIGRGFYYQNEFVHWFNHYPEPSYRRARIEPADGALVVGGGLASLDVVKILMLETVARALEARGHHADLYEMEQKGIHKSLGELGLTLPDLGLRGCILFYRRHAEDMPLAEPKENAGPQQMEQTRATRRKLLRLFIEKYLFTFQDCRAPIAFAADDDRLAGLHLAVTEAHNGSVSILEGTGSLVPSPLVISSIGSIPEPIPGVPMEGEQYKFKDAASGELESLPGVFAVGNAVTGKGNILASARHGRVVSQYMLEHYLLGTASGYEEAFTDAAAAARTGADLVSARLAGQAPVPGERITAILTHVKALQEQVHYPGEYRAWIDRIRPL
jgi:NADPH-dependent glutamate synthase beta subunit-like oxidoreductase